MDGAATRLTQRRLAPAGAAQTPRRCTCALGDPGLRARRRGEPEGPPTGQSRGRTAAPVRNGDRDALGVAAALDPGRAPPVLTFADQLDRLATVPAEVGSAFELAGVARLPVAPLAFRRG